MYSTMQCDHSLGFSQILHLVKKQLEDEWPKKGNIEALSSVIEQWIMRVFWQTNSLLLWCRHYWQAGQYTELELSVSLASEELFCSLTFMETIKCSHSSPEWCTGKSEFCYSSPFGDCTEHPGWVSIFQNVGRALLTLRRVGVPSLEGAEWRSWAHHHF